MKNSTNGEQPLGTKQKSKCPLKQVEEVPSPLDYQTTLQAVKAAEEDYCREYNNPQSTKFVKALLALDDAKRVRAKAALAEVQSRRYAVRRTRFSDGASTVMDAPEALAQLHEDYLPDYDVVPADDDLRAGLPVFSWEAAYYAV